MRNFRRLAIPGSGVAPHLRWDTTILHQRQNHRRSICRPERSRRTSLLPESLDVVCLRPDPERNTARCDQVAFRRKRFAYHPASTQLRTSTPECRLFRFAWPCPLRWVRAEGGHWKQSWLPIFHREINCRSFLGQVEWAEILACPARRRCRLVQSQILLH